MFSADKSHKICVGSTELSFMIRCCESNFLLHVNSHNGKVQIYMSKQKTDTFETTTFPRSPSYVASLELKWAAFSHFLRCSP